LRGLEGHTVDPHQFLGLEINPRAAAIAELVLWIGYLQWHLRTQSGFPSEPILKAFHNIVVKDAVLEATVTLVRDKSGKPVTRVGADGTEAEVYRYDSPRQPEWPEAEFIVGNPPFIGGKRMRDALGDNYVEALWHAHPGVNESADYVMFWWDRSAALLTAPSSYLRQFGLVTTNSITQVFNRRVLENRLRSQKPIFINFAIGDHPWTKATRDAAAVRIAMTVGCVGRSEGRLEELISEEALDTDAPALVFKEQIGIINPDLSVGTDLTVTTALKGNAGICQQGVKLVGDGFVLSHAERDHFVAAGPNVIKRYLSGLELVQHPKQRSVIDFSGLDADAARRANPVAYQRILQIVKPFGDHNREPSRRINWWLFGRSNVEMRSSIAGLERFIATPEVAKHRPFRFVDADVILDASLYCIALEDAWDLGVLMSRIHTVWAHEVGGTLEDRPRYHNTPCFARFPFPSSSKDKEERVRAIAEELDSHRKRVLAEHPHLTLTGLYNVLEKLRAGTDPAALTASDRRIFDDGLVLILKELHDKLDAAVAEAYGWPADLSDNDILARLVALNRERAQEEANGLVRWLRPDYQIPRFGTAQQKAQLSLQGGAMRAPEAPAETAKPAFPTDETAQTAAVMAALASASAPLNVEALAARFRQGRRVAPKVGSVLGALQRMGFVTSADAGHTWTLRRVA
jgi:hypothetical protein